MEGGPGVEVLNLCLDLWNPSGVEGNMGEIM